MPTALSLSHSDITAFSTAPLCLCWEPGLSNLEWCQEMRSGSGILVTGPDLWGEKNLRNREWKGLSNSPHSTLPILMVQQEKRRPREKGGARVSQHVSTGARIRPLGP